MNKLSIFVPRPNEINAMNPRSQKRQDKHSFKAMGMIGASRINSEFGGVMDKVAVSLTRLPSMGPIAKAKLLADATKKGIKVVEHNGQMYYELPKHVAESTKATDAYGFIGRKHILEGAGFSKKGSLTEKAQAVLNKLIGD